MTKKDHSKSDDAEKKSELASTLKRTVEAAHKDTKAEEKAKKKTAKAARKKEKEQRKFDQAYLNWISQGLPDKDYQDLAEQLEKPIDNTKDEKHGNSPANNLLSSIRRDNQR